MATNQTESKQVNDLIAAMGLMSAPTAQKTDEELIEQCHAENNIPKLKDIPIKPNPFTSEVIEYMEQVLSAIHTLSDSETKSKLLWLYGLTNEAILDRDAIELEAKKWREKSDTLFTEIIKNSYVTPARKASFGNLARA